MTPEDAQTLQAFGAGKVIRRIDCPTAETRRRVFAKDTGRKSASPAPGPRDWSSG